MEIENLVPDFQAYWTRAQSCDPSEQKLLWHEVYANHHQPIFDLYFRDYASPSHLEQALQHYPEAMVRIDELAVTTVRSLQQDTPRIAAMLGAQDHLQSLRSIVLVGVFASNAWQDVLDRRPTCFFAVEQIPTTLAATVTVAHEVTHGLQSLVNSTIHVEETLVGQILLLEGLAVHASARAVPGLSETAYLWMGEEQTPLGMPVAEWTTACVSAWSTLRSALLRDFLADDEPTNGAYFSVRRTYLRDDVPERAGYFVAHRLVTALAKQHTLAAMAAWPREHALGILKDALAATVTCPTYP